MANPRFNKQVTNPRGPARVKRAGGGMGGRTGDMMYSRGQGEVILRNVLATAVMVYKPVDPCRGEHLWY